MLFQWLGMVLEWLSRIFRCFQCDLALFYAFYDFLWSVGED